MHAIKKILPAAILAAFAGAAQAQTTLYGLIDMSYGKSEFVGESNADFHSGGDDFSSQGNSTSRFGFKGSTDVGSGVKVNFKLESNGITSDGAVNGPNFFNRQAWLGLSGGFGEVRLGKQDNVPFQVMGAFDFNGQSNAASAAFNSTVGVWGSSLGRQARSLQYISPSMGGFQAHVGFVPDGDSATDNEVFSGAVSYSAGGFAAAISGQTKQNDTGVEDFASVAASYDFKVAKVMVGYADADTGGTNADNKGYSLGINVPVAGYNIGAHYAVNDIGLQDEAVEVWVNREIFKNTYGYAEYGYAEKNNQLVNPTASDLETFAIGVIYVF